MFIVDLECCNNHRFEGWYGDRGEYAQIVADGDLTCPLCETHEVKRVLTTGAPKTSKTREKQERNNEIPPYEYVGTRFYDTANDMLEGRRERAPIAGIISDEKADELEEKGVPLSRIKLGGPMTEEPNDEEIH